MAKFIAATFDKDESANSLSLCGNECLFMWGAYFCMGSYKWNGVVAIKMVPIFMGAYFLWVLIILILWYGI